MGCSMIPPAFTCRPSCCQDGRELRLISRGALCHQATEAHGRIAQDAQSLGRVPLLDGLVDGSNAQGHCGERQRGLRLGQEAMGPGGGEHLPSPSAPPLLEGGPESSPQPYFAGQLCCLGRPCRPPLGFLPSTRALRGLLSPAQRKQEGPILSGPPRNWRHSRSSPDRPQGSGEATIASFTEPKSPVH